jgi:hypothetical protein
MKNETDTDSKAEALRRTAFLESKIFVGLENKHQRIKDKSLHYFSEDDFKKVLDRCEYFGLGIYKIQAWFKKKPFESSVHEDYNKKSTHPKWYNNAFIALKKREKDMLFSADYRVSKKLLVEKPGLDSPDE